ncbi:hypothetical protein KVT40_004919 [Elsinoe batatas]|uniref:Uncharacterized protein n=1 Tax=Elsinoe batatas TaxID=2601811 RepID=A0A8K0PF36_9PEZI|nr:hypothetical protein KVT40_004919 [Elsinoe batatas]
MAPTNMPTTTDFESHVASQTGETQLSKIYTPTHLPSRLKSFLTTLATTSPLPGSALLSLATYITAKASLYSEAFPAVQTRIDLVVLEVLMLHRPGEGWGPRKRSVMRWRG